MVGGKIDAVKAYFQVKVKAKGKQMEKDRLNRFLITVRIGRA